MAAALGAALICVAGCKSDTETTADKIELLSGTDQLGEPGELLPEPLAVRVVGPRSVDFLGRRGVRHPVEGVPVTFAVEALFKKGFDRTSFEGDPQPADNGHSSSPPGDASRPAGAPETAAPEDVPLDAQSLPPHPALYPFPGGRERSYTRKTVLTDAAGIARVDARLGGRNGDWRIDATIDRKGEKVRFRVVAGVKKDFAESESVVGAKVPIGLRLTHLVDEKNPKSLKPIRDRKVLYQIAGGPPGGIQTVELKEKDRQSRTDDDGRSETEITLGQKPGVYYVLAELEPKADEEPVRGILLGIAAMDWGLVCWKLASGVLVFVIGVRLLGNGFLLASSPILHLTTGSLAQSRLRGYLGGLAAGAVFESSSLVTSHLTNLSNGGLLSATAGLGLVLGANAGGTMLPQLLSLDIGVLSAPFLAAGTLLLLMPRKFGLAPWGWVLLGAGLALAGWTLLEDAAELAAYSKRLKTEVLFGDVDYSLSFAAILARYLAYFVLGSLAAFVLRTSNLVVVIAILLASSGIVQAVTALPLILGANLGSAAMVFVLSLRKRREAKRLALANLVVQMFGVTAAVILSLVTVGGQPVFVWLIDFLTPGKLVAALPANVESHLATAHTFYNLLAGIAFVFFPAPLFSVVDRLLPPKPVAQDVKPYLLDKNLITVPALALRQVTEETIYLTEICRKTVAEAFDSFRYNDLDLSDQVVRREEVISEMHREVSQYLVEICENQLARRDASRVGVLQTTASGLGRIGELGELLREVAARKIEEHVASDPEVERDLNEVYDLVMAQFANILSLLRQGDTKTEENAVKMTERIAKFGSRFESQARQRIEQAGIPANPVQMHVQTLVYHEAFNTLFRVAGNLTHIAECMRILSPDRF